MSTQLERARHLLLRGVVAGRVGDSWLAHLISGEHRRFLAARQARLGHAAPDLAAYPAEARRPLEAGRISGGRGDALLIVWPHAPGVARIGVATPDTFTTLGDDILAFLRAELIALGLDIADIPTGPAVGPKTGGFTRVLRADHDTPPGPTQIDRLGGKPIGFDAATWPRLDGAPMHHVLTLDLREHPTYQPKGARALALFISSPMRHEAYTPQNRHTRVILLDETDLQKGEPAWPPELADADDRLQPGTLRYESSAGLGERELFQHSFAGGFPIWLQGDDTESFFGGDDDDEDYDSEDDDEHSEPDDRPAPPTHFILQFDESLIPGLNLGDEGIMYVFAETAWFQCH